MSHKNFGSNRPIGNRRTVVASSATGHRRSSAIVDHPRTTRATTTRQTSMITDETRRGAPATIMTATREGNGNETTRAIRIEASTPTAHTANEQRETTWAPGMAHETATTHRGNKWGCAV